MVPMINTVPIWALHFSINFPALIVMGWQIKGLPLNPALPSGPGRRKGKERYIPTGCTDSHSVLAELWKHVFNFLPRQTCLLDHVFQICLNVSKPCLSVGPSGFQLANEELCTHHKNSAKNKPDFSSI